jgi:hypothetical protein
LPLFKKSMTSKNAINGPNTIWGCPEKAIPRLRKTPARKSPIDLRMGLIVTRRMEDFARCGLMFAALMMTSCRLGLLERAQRLGRLLLGRGRVEAELGEALLHRRVVENVDAADIARRAAALSPNAVLESGGQWSCHPRVGAKAATGCELYRNRSQPADARTRSIAISSRRSYRMASSGCPGGCHLKMRPSMSFVASSA